jgi:hypothetical protein
MGPVKPVSAEAAFPQAEPAAAVKGAAPLSAGGKKPPLIIPTAADPVPPKTQVLPSPFGAPTSFAGAQVQELHKQTAALLGLPQDTLSFVLISAIRCFSLAPDAALLGRLRGELLASGAASAPKTGREKAALESKALAAAATADKGLRVSAAALEEYAAAMEPGVWFSGGGGQGPPEQEELKKLYAKANREGQEELLSWLNRLPGRNGQHWAVFPFKIKVGGVELKVSVRLLIQEDSFLVPGKNAGRGCVIVDIEGLAQNWRFILDRSGGKSVMDITVYSGQAADIKALEKEAGKFFGGVEIRVQKSDEAPFLTGQVYSEALPSINEKV